MRVLNLGCGAGDVSMLAGKLVGPSGSVVGIDPNAGILAVARARAQADGLLHVTFSEASVGTFSELRPFDLVVARYVLTYQVDPVAFLRAAARFATPGGILALHEFMLDRPVHSRPYVELWQQATDWLMTTFWSAAPSWDAAARLIEHFYSAGLPQPELFSETPVGGGVDAPHYAWLAGVARTLLPRMVETGRARDVSGPRSSCGPSNRLEMHLCTRSHVGVRSGVPTHEHISARTDIAVTEIGPKWDLKGHLGNRSHPYPAARRSPFAPGQIYPFYP